MQVALLLVAEEYGRRRGHSLPSLPLVWLPRLALGPKLALDFELALGSVLAPDLGLELLQQVPVLPRWQALGLVQLR